MRAGWTRRVLLAVALATAGVVPGATMLSAQVRTIDPNQAIDADLAASHAPRTTPPPAQTGADFQRYPDEPAPAATPVPYTPPPAAGTPTNAPPSDTVYAPPVAPATGQDVARDAADAKAATGETFQRQELLRAAEGTFGQGTSGLAGILERTLKEQGLPSAYIAGREAAGAVVVGLRYGQGTMFHKVEGSQPVYWTGPSLGFDLGGDATKVFVLVYNLYDSEDLYRRFPAAEGRLYFVGGFAATYLRRGNIVLIPIRLGIGWRQGVNIGYMKFSHKAKVLPF